MTEAERITDQENVLEQSSSTNGEGRRGTFGELVADLPREVQAEYYNYLLLNDPDRLLSGSNES